MSETGKLSFTVDFPALYAELIEPGNIVHLGPGGAMGLQLVLIGLRNIAVIALEEPDRYAEIIQILKNLGVVADGTGNLYIEIQKRRKEMREHVD